MDAVVICGVYCITQANKARLRIRREIGQCTNSTNKAKSKIQQPGGGRRNKEITHGKQRLDKRQA